MAGLAHLHGISERAIASALRVNRQTVRRARKIFHADGADGLFAPKRRSNLKVNDSALKAMIFSILHEPPSNHAINRTSWTMAHLCEVLSRKGKPACPEVVRTITKAAGYKWRKARVVLTSNDPDYDEKLTRIRSILSELQPDEAFFSTQGRARERRETKRDSLRSKDQGGQRWITLYPGDFLRAGDNLHWTGRDQTWNYQCASCHSTNLKKNYDLAGWRFSQRSFFVLAETRSDRQRLGERSSTDW
jgi:transposase